MLDYMASSTVDVTPESLHNEKSSLEQFRKLFIGGLTHSITDERLKEYCSKYGEITECVIVRDRTGQSRGFAFVSFKDRDMIECFMQARPHAIDGKKIEPKRAMPRNEASKLDGQLTVKKIFIGGMKEDITEVDLKSHFQKFGNIIECNIIKDKEDKLRGFAFITFDDYDGVDRCILEKPHIINDKELDVRKAIPREQITRTNSTFLTYPQMNPDMFYPSYPMHNSLSYNFSHLSKPMPLMNNTGSYSHLNGFSPSMLFYPSDLSNTSFFPSLPTNNHMVPYQNSTRNKSASEQISRPRSTNDEQHRKLFLGGLSLKTTDDTLKDYATKFGEITDCLVMKDQNGQSKCFGFVTFLDSKVVDEFMKQRPHILDGRQIDPKRAMPREEANNDDVHLTVKKIFIGGIRDGIDDAALRKHFEEYGIINDCLFINDKDGKTRGFAFIEFEDYDSVDKVILARPHIIGENRIDVKKAVPKDQRQFQTRQQQYALQMQAATAAYYWYNNFAYHTLRTPSAIMNQNGALMDDVFAPVQTLNTDNHLSNSFRYFPKRNTRQQSSYCNQ